MMGKGYTKIAGATDDTNNTFHPLRTANIFSIITFRWMNDVLEAGNKHPLEQSDVLPLHDNDKAKVLAESLKKEWNSHIDNCKKGKTKPKLWKSVLKTISLRNICIAWSLMLLESFGRIMQPILVGFLVQFLRNPDQDPSILYCCAALMSFNGLLYILAHSGNFYLDLLGMKLRGALQTIVYHKVT